MSDPPLPWRLEAAFDAAWPSLRQIPVGDWTCKLGGGVSRRSNSANPVRAGAALDAAALAEIQAVYAAAGLPAYVRVPSVLPPQADALLAAAGWTREGGTLTLTAPLAAGAAEAELSPTPTLEWVAALDAFNGRDAAASAAFSGILARLAVPAAFAAMRREARIVSGAYAAIHDGWVCIEAVATDPAARGMGLASQVVRSLLAWGAARGGQGACLQVSQDNAAGLGLYRRLGFDTEAYRYHYRRAPRPQAG